MAPACKDWASVVHALLEGEQILDVRKGGIREDGRHFSVQATRFWRADGGHFAGVEGIKINGDVGVLGEAFPGDDGGAFG